MMKRFLTLGIAGEIVIYSGDPFKFDIFANKTAIVEKLKKLLDMTSYEEVVCEDEIKFILKKEIFDTNIEAYIKNVLETFDDVEIEEYELNVGYFENDYVARYVQSINEHLGVDVNYTVIFKRVEDDTLLETFANGSLKLKTNPLVGVSVFNLSI